MSAPVSAMPFFYHQLKPTKTFHSSIINSGINFSPLIKLNPRSNQPNKRINSKKPIIPLWESHKNNLLSKFSPHILNMKLPSNITEAKQLYFLYSKIILTLDILIIFINIIIITVSFIGYLKYINNKYTLNTQINTFRICSLIISVIVCVLISIRTYTKHKLKYIKYILSIKLSRK